MDETRYLKSRAKTARGRLRQIENWCRDHHETTYPVKSVTWAAGMKDFGDTTFFPEGKYLRIRCDKNLLTISIPLSIHIIMHEWAHAMSWDNSSTEYHCDEWAKAYARLYRHFFDELGYEESKEYDPAPWK